MKKQLVTFGSLVFLVSGVLLGCSQTPTPEAGQPQTEATSEILAPTGEVGTMQFRANGEDFVRQGFTTKDGWQVNFDHIYVNISDATAYETFTPYDAEAGGEPQAKQTISLVVDKTVDLAAGGEDAETILVNEVPAPPGRYNALSWKMNKAQEGPAAGYTMVMQGTATKGGQTVPFTLKLDQELAFTCGDFVGENRKGILQPGETAQLEATFHFDHLFGDGEAPADDEINTGALGFEPLAKAAKGSSLDADLATLKQQLSSEEYNKLIAILPSLGHVGEGHCKETQLTAQKN
ncbi:DUF4382 domain-containing protein [Limnoraphis robusta]|uniref:DUF4382 domain-containing protein n=1 Tax=Limnoraphis robusta TaxID=1118279 RepID=UPI002B1ED4BB|nr:DUF4382 domain-containing protein [Limnoraphis robusta]MEA5501189.1 DUF4382 domain-containing protein [Limnoraphis robusta BA-68 BA1]